MTVTRPAPAPAIPCEWYFDQRVLELEQERIFERSWQCVGVLGALERPGDYVTGTVGRVPIVVVRDEQGALRAYVNVCLHRCSVIAQGSGNCRKLQCPYHAWTYDLDGRLVAAPRFNREHDFDFADFRLEEVRVQCLGPLVMVNLDPSAPSLQDQLEGLLGRMAKDGLALDELEHAGHWESEQAANWKVLVENFNECYHCPTAHQQFSQLLAVDPEHYLIETARWTSRAVVPLRPNGAQAVAGYPEGENDKGQYALLWPAFTLSQSPGPRRVVACWFEPITPDRTLMVCETFVDPNMTSDEIDVLDRFSERVAAEDQQLVESVQRGLRSGRVPHAHLMRGSEGLVDHFDQLVLDALSDRLSGV